MMAKPIRALELHYPMIQCLLKNKQLLFHKCALDMRWIVTEVCSAKVAIIISYPQSVSGIIIVLLKNPTKY